MTCNFTKLRMKDGTEVQAIVCTRGGVKFPLPCVVCGKPHTKLCDGKPGNWPNIKASGGMCSAPLCSEHAHHVEPNQDYCPRCVATGAKE